MGADKRKLARELKKVLPQGMIPDDYLKEIIESAAEYADTQEEAYADAKMQINEEAGLSLPMSREEAEAYLGDELEDAQWESISKDGFAPASAVLEYEEADGRSVLETIKTLPLLPSARLISAVFAWLLEDRGIRLTKKEQEELFNQMIHLLDMPLMDIVEQSDSDDDDDDESDDDGSGEAGRMPEEDADAGIEQELNPGLKKRRITRFTKR